MTAALTVPLAVTASAQTITSFNPSVGQAGQSVTITGSGFTASTKAYFNGVQSGGAATSATIFQAIVPSGATTGPISVQNPGGSPFTTIAHFTVIGPGPYVTNFTPVVGSGGTMVTIQGVQFNAGTTVRFNGTNAASVFVQSALQIQATTQSNVTTGPITVSNSLGSHTTGSNFYVPPVIAGFSPSSAPAGSNVVVTGRNFLGASAVKFNGLSATAYTVNNNGQITATVPAGATSGKISVEVAASGSQAISTNTFLVAPTITGFAPNAGAPGTNVTITGNNLLGLQSVTFNGVSAAFSGVTSNQLTATVPAGARTGFISITTTNGTATTTNLFFLPPGVSTFSPTNSPPGSTVTVNGTNFQAASSVKFNGQNALTFTLISSNQLTAVVPNNVTTGPISVTGPAGTGTSTALFYGPPAISGFTPALGLPGTNVTVFGTNFQGASSVKFNGVNATFSNVSSNQLMTVVPGGTTNGPITVTTPGGTATSPTDFVIDFKSDLILNAFNDAPDPVPVNSNLTYSIGVGNLGPSEAPLTTVSIALPANVALVSASTMQGTVNTNGNPIIVNLGTLTVSSFPNITIVVRPLADGPITATATISSPRPDPVTGNNNREATTTVLPVPRLTIVPLPNNKVRLSWPAVLTNYNLQFNPNLTQSGGWANVAATPVIVGNERVVTNDVTGTNRFFRLRQ